VTRRLAQDLWISAVPNARRRTAGQENQNQLAEGFLQPRMDADEIAAKKRKERKK